MRAVIASSALSKGASATRSCGLSASLVAELKPFGLRPRIRSPNDFVSPRAEHTSAVLARTSAHRARITDRSAYPNVDNIDRTWGKLIPWVVEETRGTIWCVSHRSREAFDLGDYGLLSCLADFASLVLRHQSADLTLRQGERQAAYAVIVNELAHRINNPLQGLDKHALSCHE
jgi:hypothetical protein